MFYAYSRKLYTPYHGIRFPRLDQASERKAGLTQITTKRYRFQAWQSDSSGADHEDRTHAKIISPHTHATDIPCATSSSTPLTSYSPHLLLCNVPGSILRNHRRGKIHKPRQLVSRAPTSQKLCIFRFFG